jgi:hypothetical protein
MSTDKVSRGTLLPDDWQPSPALLAWAQAARPDLSTQDFRVLTESFRDYWHSTTKNAKKRDWDATFRNHIRTARKPPYQPSTRNSGVVL